MAVALTYNGHSGFVKCWEVPDPISFQGAYIVEGSVKDIEDPNFSPYTSEDALFYYIQENGDIMNERYFSEDDTASDIAAAVLFIGLYPDGSGGFINKNFTPAQLVDYIANSLNFDMNAVDGTTQSDVKIGSREIATINDGQQTYNRSAFTQTGDSFEMTNGVSFYAGQLLNIQLR